MTTTDEPEILYIEPKAIFSFDGKIVNGLIAHPDAQHILYAIGNKISICQKSTFKEEFITGHSNQISCIAISPDGKYLASGQINYGLPAYVIIWDWETKKEFSRHELHKVRVQSLSFTAENKYLISLGGQDDGTIIVFDMELKAPICQAVASRPTTGIPNCVIGFHKLNSVFIVAGDHHLRLWSIHRQSKKLTVADVLTGKSQRRYTSMALSPNDQTLYLTTMTGDLAKVSLNCCDPLNVTKEGMNAVLLANYGRHNPKLPAGKDCEKYVNGLRSILIINDKHFLLGAGDGTIEVVEERGLTFKCYPSPTWPNLKILYSKKINGAVSSITRFNLDIILIGAETNDIYQFYLKNYTMNLIRTCHTDIVYDIAFPINFSMVFATASYESIRIWSTKRMKELLRIMVYNFSCKSIKFSFDGTMIVSAWNDGVLRAFTPISGRLIWAIPNAHNKGCSAVTISSNGRLLVTGGIEGQVRVWKIETCRQSLIAVLKEHAGAISSLDFNKFDTEVVSSCHDGSCVIWDISRLTRKHVFYANTQFTCARYFPTGVQILTSGSNHVICYWEVYDASLVREIEGSSTSVNSVTISNTGEYFVSVGNDQLVKLWDYQKGIPLCIGSAHASAVVSCAYSPCGKFFVTASSEGAIIIWSIPKQYHPTGVDPLKKREDSKISITSKRSLGSVKKENIEQLEAKQSNKDVLCCECPPADCKALPDINESCNEIPCADEQNMCKRI